MSDDLILEALHTKEAELVRDLESINRKMEHLRSDLSELRAVAAFHRQNIGNADFLPHMSVRRQFSRGEILGHCLAALRQSGGTLDTRELARAVMAAKGLDVEDTVLRKKIVFSVMQVMKSSRRHRKVVDDGRRLGVRLWKIASP